MKRDVHPKVKLILKNASSEASSFGDSKVRPPHIALALLNDYDNEGVKVLLKLKVNTNQFYDTISENVRQSDITIPVIDDKKRGLALSEDSKIIIQQLDKECNSLNDKIIDTVHLTLALLAIKSPICTWFNEIGINYSNYKDKVKLIKKDFTTSSFDGEDILNQDNQHRRMDPLKSTTEIGRNKTPVLDNFCRDISKAVEKGELDAVIGREKEIKRISQILSRRKKNNPIIIGNPGVGKSAIVEGLAQLIKDGNASPTLNGKRIFALDLTSIVAGTKYRGQFEERMKAILEECKANLDIVLFIDELHTIIGTGNASGGLDASNIFKPALARGELQIIGATTLDEYRENIEKDGALTRRFQQVIIEEPTLEETKNILMNIKDKYEQHHRVIYTEEAIDECVKLSSRYIMDRAMPDKAIDVLDEAGSSMNVSIEKPENIKLLEEKVNEINETKREVVKKQKYEEAAKLRDEEKKVGVELKAAIVDWNNKLATKINVVDVAVISNVVSMMTGIPLNKISTQEGKKLLNLDKELTGKIIGQDAAVTKVIKAIKRNRVGIKDKSKPIGSFIFLGPTGVGKTHLAKLLAEEIFGDAEALIRMDMSEYMEKYSVSKLIGPPPGYVGYEQGGQLTEKVRRKPHCVILFDEIEKANEDVFNVLLQLLDEGMLTDGLGRKVNFKNALIILTSNIGVKESISFGKNMGFETESNVVRDENRVREILEKALKKKFKPEFLNRIDEAIIFNSLTRENINDIIYVELAKLEKRIQEMHYKLKVNKSAIDFISAEGYDEEYGARPLARAIQHYIEDVIADEILTGHLKEGDTIVINYDKTKQEIVVKSGKNAK